MMKQLFQLTFFLLIINSCSNQDIATITFKDGQGLRLTKIGNFRGNHLLMFPFSPRIYNYDSTNTRFNNITIYDIKTIRFDLKTHEIIDITFQYNISSESNNTISPCEPDSITSPQGYKKNSILKHFQAIKNITTINWHNQDGCSKRANDVSYYFKNQRITAYKSFALPSRNGVCYSQNNPSGIPLWLYHVASCIFCSEDNQYYVFDLFFDEDKPIKYEEWQGKLKSNLKCEKYAICDNSCNAYTNQVLCTCQTIDE